VGLRAQKVEYFLFRKPMSFIPDPCMVALLAWQDFWTRASYGNRKHQSRALPQARCDTCTCSDLCGRETVSDFKLHNFLMLRRSKLKDVRQFCKANYYLQRRRQGWLPSSSSHVRYPSPTTTQWGMLNEHFGSDTQGSRFEAKSAQRAFRWDFLPIRSARVGECTQYAPRR